MDAANETIYREMTAGDYAAAIRLWQETEGMALSEADSEENISFYLARNPGFSFVCEIGGRLAGTILAGHDGRRGYIYHCAVSREHRGRGIGRELAGWSLSRLREAGIAKCHLFVISDNEGGGEFWSRTGWQKRSGFDVYSANTPPLDGGRSKPII
ncbi:GNAT family N-acetyltransferase [Paenibacillus humicola]|uniref:GNAT family N-acetyltransferase n=1 Tax=Paenibacillus humicola TaxID=3110540 RepID=UPI00237B9565|nr:GNAT family N-acetyltransferase [Paenibacillus humicola]